MCIFWGGAKFLSGTVILEIIVIEMNNCDLVIRFNN